MNGETNSLWTWFAGKWERLVAVDVPDEEEARLGRLFNTLMVISTGIVIALALTFVWIGALGLISPFIARLAAAFPLAFIPLSIFCLVQAKRGRVRPMIAFYVWVNFFGLALAVLVFDGVRSAAWILYIWTITIAGTLLAPGYALGMTGLVIGYFMLLLLLTQMGFYAPPFSSGLGREFMYIAFTMIMLVSTVGLLTYLNMRSLREALGRLRMTTHELEEHRRTLEQHVAERTAALQRRTVQLEAAAEVARDATAVLDVEALMRTTVERISERFGFYHAGIFLVDEQGEYAILRAASSEGGKRMLERGHRLKVGEEGIVGYVAGTGEPRIALDVGEDAVWFNNPDLPHTRSEMALPLRVRGRVIGVLDVQSTEPAAFTEEDMTILQTMADQIALAIENARLLAEAQDRLREVTALTREYARREWEQLVSERPGWGYIYDGIEVRPGKPTSDPSGASAPLTLPLQAPGGEMIGRLLVSLPDRAPTPEEIALTQAVAEQAALALESARLFQQTRQTLQEVEILYRASEALIGARTPDEVLRAFTDYLVSEEIGRCVLALIDPASPPDEPIVEIKAAWERGVEHPAVLGNRWNVSQIPLIGAMPREPLIIPDVSTSPILDSLSRHFFLNVLGIRALIALPLIAGERHLGWLLVESLEKPVSFQEREFRLYRALSDQAAVVLERMRLLEEMQQRAEWERIRAEVSARVRASTDIDTILRTAVRELGRALRATEGVIQLHGGDGRSGT